MREDTGLGETDDGRPRLLLHVCCAPCSTACIERLRPDYDVVLYWYNPNITDRDEYQRRLGDVRRYAEIAGVELIEGPHDTARWEQAAEGLLDEPEGGRRCDECFRLRLNEAFRVAGERGIRLLTTTLTIGPHKSLEKVSGAAGRAARSPGAEFVAIDFKKKGGSERSTQLSKEHDLYRQDFCGCEPSRRERGRQRARRG